MLTTSQLLELVLQYIGNPNQEQGILITGEWGAGKTYFFKHTLSPAIQQLCKQFPNKKGFPKKGALYLSLNGVTSVDDIRHLLFCELYPPLKHTRINFLKLFLQILPTYFKQVSLLEYISSFIDPTEYILCFDDMERIDCSLKSVLGYINRFIEHKGIKTIIICNEKEVGTVPPELVTVLKEIGTEIKDIGTVIKKASPVSQEVPPSPTLGDKDVYNRFKEKLIWNTFLYTPDMVYILDAIIDKYHDSDFRTFIKRHRPFILSIIANTGLGNVRTLTFTVGVLYNLFREFASLTTNQYLEQEIVRFTLAMCFECKHNTIDRDVLERFVSSPSDIISMAYMKRTHNDSNRSLDKFIETYGFTSYPKLFASQTIFTFINSGYLNCIGLRQAVQTFSDQHREATPTDLYTGDYYRLTDNEFIKLSEDFLEKIKSGDIADQKSFLRLYNYMSYYARCGLLTVSRDDLETMFINSLELLKGKWRYQDITPIKGIYRDDTDVMALFTKVSDINNDLHKRECIVQAREVLTGSTAELLERIYSTKTDIWLNPFFRCFDTSELLTLIMQMPNSDLWEIGQRLRHRYSMAGMPATVTDDLIALGDLKNQMESIVVGTDCNANPLKCHLLANIVNVIKSISQSPIE